MTNTSRMLAYGTILVLALAMFVSVSDRSRAGQTSGTIEIDEGAYYGWRMDIVIPSQVEVELTSSNGTPVDVLVMDQENYTRFSNLQEFEFIEAYSLMAVTTYTKNMTVLSGTVYIIVDNSDRPSVLGAASSPGPVEIEYWLGSTFDLHAVPGGGNEWLVYLFLGVGAIVFVIVIALTRIALRQQKKLRGQRPD